jgi:hypothetical protein
MILAFGNNIQFVHSLETVDITPTDDAYVVANYDDPSDARGLQHINTGHLPFLKMWYAWDVTKTGNERITSIIYLKFNLTKVNGPIESASLVLHPFAVNLTAPLRASDMYTASNNNWNESSLVFMGAPAFSTAENSTAFLSNPEVNESISWDATRQVRDHEGSFLTLALVLRSMHLHNEELVNFYSKEANDPSTRPSLVIVSSESHGTQTSESGSITGDTMYGSIYTYIALALLSIVIVVVLKRRKQMAYKKDPTQPR